MLHKCFIIDDLMMNWSQLHLASDHKLLRMIGKDWASEKISEGKFTLLYCASLYGKSNGRDLMKWISPPTGILPYFGNFPCNFQEIYLKLTEPLRNDFVLPLSHVVQKKYWLRMRRDVSQILLCKYIISACRQIFCALTLCNFWRIF